MTRQENRYKTKPRTIKNERERKLCDKKLTKAMHKDTKKPQN